jgi:phage terminase small subunit
MPARKPVGLHTRHATKAEKRARVAAEESLAPERGLPMAAPARLKGHAIACEAWRRLIRLYNELDAAIVTRLDQDLLCDYCILMEQIGELDLMRSTTYRMWLEMGAAHDKAIRKAKEAVDAQKAVAKALAENGAPAPEDGPGSLAEVEKWEAQAVALASKSLDAFEAVVKLDARADQKRKALLQLRQSLYLTPRSRAGVAPTKKEEEEPLDPMDQLLGTVVDYVNNGDGQ